MNSGIDHTNKGTLCTPYLAKRPLNVGPTKNDAVGLQHFILFIWRTREIPCTLRVTALILFSLQPRPPTPPSP